MINDNENAKQELINLLKKKCALLMGGAGISKSVGFPLWNELLIKMRDEFCLEIPDPGEMGYLKFADKIKNEMQNGLRINDYYRFIENNFEPKGRNYNDFHCLLVKLGFCGIITTNYDEVLESAVKTAYSNGNIVFDCQEIDLCNKRHYDVFKFLRDLNNNNDDNPRRILHIHGHYRNPQDIILTENDYLKKYGQPPDEIDGKPERRILDSLHRRLLWALAATRPFVFVGFGMKDEFFLNVIKIIQADFQLGSEGVHFAIMPKVNTYEKTIEFLERKGIKTVFYEIQYQQHQDYNRGLKNLIEELAQEIGIPILNPDFNNLSRKMLER